MLDKIDYLVKRFQNLSYFWITKIFIVVSISKYKVLSVQSSLSTLSSPFMRFLFPNKNRIMQESHKWRKNIDNILYTALYPQNTTP